MNDEKLQRWFYFTVAILAAIILGWFGSKWLHLSPDDSTSSQFAWAGLLLVLIGAMLISAASNRFWWVNAVIILIGFYCFARSLGVVGLPFVAWAVGIASWFAAAFLLYLSWPPRVARKNARTTPPDNDVQ